MLLYLQMQHLMLIDLFYFSNLTTVITNGVGANTLLLGNQLNPASAVAQKMTDTLHAELEAHSIYKDEEEKMTNLLVGPAIPGKKEVGDRVHSLDDFELPALDRNTLYEGLGIQYMILKME